jgi:ER membrane protein complex subunit 1
MRQLLLLCAAILFHADQTAALHESDVGVVDWHKLLIGLPNFHAPWTLPLFHRVRNLTDDTTSSFVITATKANVLAALEPENGKIGACAVSSIFSRRIAA